MARTSLSENLRRKLQSSPSYSARSSASSVASSTRSAMANVESKLDEVYREEANYFDPSSTENRAGWLASIADAFGFGREEEEEPAAETPDETTTGVGGEPLVARPEAEEPVVETEMPEVPVETPDENTVALDAEALEAMIRQEATLRNIDPDIAVRIWRSEGGTSYQSNIEREGSGSEGGREASYGPFQLFTGGGLGNEYERLTGRELVNDNTLEGVRKQVQFALDMAVDQGWTPWYGRRTAGVGARDGLQNAVRVNNWQDNSGAS